MYRVGFLFFVYCFESVESQVPIYVSSVQNLLLCLLVATMNFVSNCFRRYQKQSDFRSTSFARERLCRQCSVPQRRRYLLEFSSRFRCHFSFDNVIKIIFQIALVLTTMMWTLIPVTASLQLIGLSRQHQSGEKMKESQCISLRANVLIFALV